VSQIGAIYSVGKRRIAEVLATNHEAQERLLVVREDNRVLEIGAWCERSKIALTFVQEGSH
jgi:hypothetical protein